MKKIALFLALVSIVSISNSQRIIEHEKIDETFYSVVGQTYNILSEITVTIDEPGKVVLTMAGIVDSTVGDDIILAVSDDTSWSNGSGQVVVQALSGVDDHSSFSHMMVYEVEPGTHTFYALAGRTSSSSGTGIIDLDAAFLLEFTADSAVGNVDHEEISSFLVYDDAGLLNLANYQFTPLEDGQLVVKFSGHATIPFGEEFLLVSNSYEINSENIDNLNWANYSQIITPSSVEANKHSFSYSRTFDLEADTPFEVYSFVINESDLFALGTIYGTFTYQFIPNNTSRVELTRFWSNLPYNLDPPGTLPSLLGSTTINSLANGTVIVDWSGRIHFEATGKTTLWITTEPIYFLPQYTEIMLLESSVVDFSQEFSVYYLQEVYAGETTFYFYAENTNSMPDATAWIRHSRDIKYLSEVELDACDDPLFALYFDHPDGIAVVESCEPIDGTVSLNEACIEQMFEDYSFCHNPEYLSYCISTYYNECLQQLGCTYLDATNYDPTALVDDGSCFYDSLCPSDINGDGSVSVMDLTLFLSEYGTECNE